MQTIFFHIQSLFFRIAHRHNDQIFWFPSSFSLDIIHVPSRDEFQGSGEPVFLRGTLHFRHGILRRRQASLNVYRQYNFFMPTFWRWVGTGALTPGFLLEHLEKRWCEQRQAMNVQIQFEATNPQ